MRQYEVELIKERYQDIDIFIYDLNPTLQKILHMESYTDEFKKININDISLGNYEAFANGVVWNPFFESFPEFTHNNGISCVFITKKPISANFRPEALIQWLALGMTTGNC